MVLKVFHNSPDTFCAKEQLMTYPTEVFVYSCHFKAIRMQYSVSFLVEGPSSFESNTTPESGS